MQSLCILYRPQNFTCQILHNIHVHLNSRGVIAGHTVFGDSCLLKFWATNYNNEVFVCILYKNDFWECTLTSCFDHPYFNCIFLQFTTLVYWEVLSILTPVCKRRIIKNSVTSLAAPWHLFHSLRSSFTFRNQYQVNMWLMRI